MANVDDYINLVGPDGQTVQAARSQLSPDFIQQYAAEQAQQPLPPAPLPNVEPSMAGTIARQGLVSMVPGGSVINAIDDFQGATPEAKAERAKRDALRSQDSLGDAAIHAITHPGETIANAVAPNMAARARVGNASTDASDAGVHAQSQQKAAANAAYAATLPPPEPNVAPGYQQADLGFRPFAPTDDKALANAYAMQQKAVRDQANVGAQKAAEEAGYQQEALKQQAQLEADRQTMVGAYQRHRQEGMDRLQKMNDEFGASQIDPQRYWGNRSGFDKAMAGIAVALGGFAGGQNQALGIIQQAVSDDIAAQNANLARKDKAIDNQKGLVSMMRQNFGDDIEANAAAKSALTSQLQSRIQMIASKYTSPELKAKADGLIGQLEEQKQKNIFDFSQRREETAIKKGNLELEREKNGIAAMAKVGGKPMEAKAVSDIADMRSVIDMVKDAQKAYEGLGAGSSIGQYAPGSDANAYRNSMNLVVQRMGKALEGGVLKEPDFERYKGMVPAAGEMNKSGKRKYETLVRELERQLESIVKTHQQAGYNTHGIAAPSVAQPVPFTKK